jgi:D-tyrosyl-tRNA(Tyr) deacylase
VKALLQRVDEASVAVDGEVVGTVGRGLLVYLGCARGDTEADARALAARVTGYRVFPDDAGRMGRSVVEAGGSVLVVSQFTLAANVQKGRRPDFGHAMAPDEARKLVERFCAFCNECVPVAIGRFGADMKVRSVNDGPVTFLLEEPKRDARSLRTGDLVARTAERLEG